jgi:hypothetical protein
VFSLSRKEIAKELKQDEKARGAIMQAVASSLAASKLEVVPMFVLFFFDLCTLCYLFLWIVHC